MYESVPRAKKSNPDFYSNSTKSRVQPWSYISDVMPEGMHTEDILKDKSFQMNINKGETPASWTAVLRSNYIIHCALMCKGASYDCITE